MSTAREAAKELLADIRAVNDEEELCLMQSDAATIAQSLAEIGYRKEGKA